MKKILLFTAMLSLVFGLTAFAKNKIEKKPQTKCPICKMDVNKDLYVDYDGKRVYFGCEACPEQFMKSKEKYIKQMEKEGIVLEKSPVNATDKQGKADKKMMMGNMHKKMMMNNDKDNYKMKMMKNKDKVDNASMSDKMMKNCCKKDNNKKVNGKVECTHNMKNMKNMKKMEKTDTASSSNQTVKK